MSDFETVRQLEEAEASQEKIPRKLSLEHIIKNRSQPPCSLNDFMDYLVYSEQSAESLQFFLWYCDYVERWSRLKPRQKALSPAWHPGHMDGPPARYVTYSHRRKRSDKMQKILSILDGHGKKEGAPDARSSAAAPNYSLPRSSVSSSESQRSSSSSSESKYEGQSFTLQPYRDEVGRIVRHYILENAPRHLSQLSPEDRARCVQATQQTTHPSALLPAFIVADASLRGKLHPDFLRLAATNCSQSRRVFDAVVGLIVALLGLLLDVVLILSPVTHFARIACIALWWPGLVVIFAASGGLCVSLHLRNSRHLRPWEQIVVKEQAGDPEDGYRQHSPWSVPSSPDPLRKPSMQTFGPANDPGHVISWYAQRSIWNRVFDATTPVQNTSLRLVHDRTMFFAILNSGIISTVLVVVSLFVPSRSTSS